MPTTPQLRTTAHVTKCKWNPTGHFILNADGEACTVDECSGDTVTATPFDPEVGEAYDSPLAEAQALSLANLTVWGAAGVVMTLDLQDGRPSLTDAVEAIHVHAVSYEKIHAGATASYTVPEDRSADAPPMVSFRRRGGAPDRYGGAWFDAASISADWGYGSAYIVPAPESTAGGAVPEGQPTGAAAITFWHARNPTAYVCRPVSLAPRPPQDPQTIRVLVYCAHCPDNGMDTYVVERTKGLPPGWSVEATAHREEGFPSLAEMKAMYDIVLVPGGWAPKVVNNLGTQGIATLRRFVRDGGSYIGFCAGAYAAADQPSYDPDYCVVKSSSVELPWPRLLTVERYLSTRVPELAARVRAGESIPVHNVQLPSTRVALRTTPETAWAYQSLHCAATRHAWGSAPGVVDTTPAVQTFVNCGVVFDPRSLEPGHRVLAHYDFRCVSSDERGDEVRTHLLPEHVTQCPAAVVGDFGQGRVVACGPHPESQTQTHPLFQALLWEALPDSKRW